MTKPPRHRRPLIEALEPRLLFSATADVAVFDDGNSDGQYLAQAADAVDLTSIYFPDEPLVDVSNIATSAVEQIVFVDVTLDGYEAIVSDIQQRYSSGEVAVVYLDPQLNGVEQITSALAQYTSFEAIHIVSHGSGGAVELGLTTLSQNTLFQYEDDLIQWGGALSGDANILLYGCDIAAHPSGQSLINQIAQLTAADVAASDDKTGHESLGGDWDLEYRVGEIKTPLLVSAKLQQSFVGVLATTQFINIQDGSSSQVVSSTTNIGQSFSFDNGGATYTVNQISVQLMKSAAANAQDITIQLLDGGWDDTTPLASKTINFDKLTTTLGWKTINFNDVTLNSGQTYIIRISSNNADGEVFVGYSNTNRWNNSEMIVSSIGNANADLKLLVGYNNGVNINSVNHVPDPQITGQNTSLVFSAANGNQIQISDADAFPQTMEVTLTANYGQLSLGQTTDLTFSAGDGTNDYHMRFIGSMDAVNAALATIIYTPTTNVTGEDTLRITSRDSGIEAIDAVSNVAITIYNSLNSLPADPQSVDEDNTLQFSAANGNQIQVVDTGAGVTLDPNDVQVTLSITNGSLSLASASGVNFTTGDGSSDTTMVFNGTLIEVNAVLATINFTPNSNYHGSAQLTMTTESGSLNDTDSLNITVNPVNDAPVLDSPIPDQSTQEGDMFSYTVPANTFSDVDSGTLTYTAALASGSVLPSWLQFNQATRTFSGVPDDGDVGVLNVRVTVSDGNGGTTSDTFNLTVINVNDDPFLNIPVPNQNATEDSAFTYTFPANTFGDGDVGASFTYTAELAAGGVLPGWLNFDSATRTFSGTPTNGDVGTLSIKLIANDGAGGIASDTFDIVIANTNDAPMVANQIPNQTATENALFNFTFAINTFTDPDVGNTLTYSAQIPGGAPLPAWLTFDSASRTFSGTPSNGDVGIITIEVIANDGTTTVSDFFDLDVQNVGSSNVVYETSGPSTDTQIITSGVPFFQSFFHDSIGATYTIDSIVLQLVKDPSAAAQTITVTLLSGAYNGTVVDSATISSADVGTTLAWKALDFTNTVLIDNQLYFIKIESSSNDGQVKAAIHNSDVYANGSFHSSTGAPDTDRDVAFQISSGTNIAPVIANPIPNQSATEDLAFNFQFAANTFNDADVGDTLTYTATMADGSALPSWLNFNAATRTFSGTPTNADVGTISIKVTADDGNGGALATDTFDLVIANINDAPTVANPIPNQTALEDSAFNFTFAVNTFADVDVGTTLTYTAQLAGGGALPAWLSFDAATRTFTGTPTNAHVGTISVDVIANDGNGGTVTDTFDIVVVNTNDAPTVANAIPNQTAAEDSVFNFQFDSNTFSDPDVGNTLTYSAQLTGGGALPAWLSFDAATRTFSGTPLNADVGSFSIAVTANDGSGGSVTTNFSITVTNTNDAPSVVIIPTDYYANEQTWINLHGTGISVADDDGDTLTITLSAQWSNSNLAATAGTTGVVIVSGVNTKTLVLSGTAAQLNNFFAGNNGGALTYRLSGNTPVTADVITVAASDGGLSGSDSFTVNITAVNDAPENEVPGAQVIDEGSALVFSAANGNRIQVNDLDAGAGNLEVNLSVTNGNLTLAGVAGLSFISGDGTADSAMIFRGTQADINAALAILTFNPVTDFSGSSVLTITTSDLGNTGIGGALTDTDTVAITVTNVNDAPTVAKAITDQTIAEDANFNFQFAENTFADVDGDALTYTATLAGGGALPAWLSFDAATRTFSGTPANSDVGVISINVIADDGNGGVVTENFSITITNTNDAPTVANAILDQTITEDTNFNFQFAANTFAEVDGDALTYTATLAGGGALPAWLNFDAATRTFSGTPANSDVGVISINVIADDGNGGSVTENFSVTVTNVNDAPIVANVIADQTIAEDANFNFQFAANTFADVDGDALTYTATLAGGGALPAWLSFDAATRTFSGTPANSDVGVISINVIADDDNGGVVTENFSITVTNTNDAPIVANAILDQTIAEDANFNFQFAANTFADVDGDALTYTATLVGGGALPAWLSFDAATRTFSGTPANADVGVISIDVIANDGNGGVVTENFSITVTNTNDAPIVANAILDQTIAEDANFNFQFAANTFSDVDVGDTLIYTATLAGGGALPAWLNFDAATRTFSGTPANSDVGVISIDVIANDGNGGVVTENFSITVTNTNDAPIVANAILDQTIAEDANFNFQFAANTFSDVDVGDTLIYTATLAGGGALPAWLNFDAAMRTFSGTPANSDVGVISINVIADDGNGGSVTENFSITVTNTNDAPIVANAILDQTIAEDTNFNFQFAANTFSDVDVGDTLTYTATLAGGGALPAWLSFDAATRTFSGTPANADVGVISIDVIANDGNGGVVTENFSITVTNTNDAPTIVNAIADQVVAEDASFNFQFDANAFTDVDGDTLTYIATLAGGGALPAWLNFDAATRTFSGTPANSDVGVISINVIADDGNSGVVTENFSITVTNTNDAPIVANAILDQTIAEDANFNFQFAENTFADVDGDALTYTATLAGGGALPAWLSFDAATRTFSGTPANADVGVISINVIADDGNGGVVTENFSITVTNTNDAPTVFNAIADQTTAEDSNFNFQFAENTFADVDGDALTYTATLAGGGALPAWLNFDAATRTFSGTPANSDVGVISINVIADDGNGGSVTENFSITVTNVNDVPTSNGIADIYLQAGAAPLQINLQNVFQDVENGTALLWSLVENTNISIATGVQIDPVTGVMTLTFAPRDGGSSLITLRAQDADGAAVETQFRVTLTAAVIPEPVPPVIAPVDPTPPTEVLVVPPVTPPISITPDTPDSLPSGGAGEPISPDIGQGGLSSPDVTYQEFIVEDSERTFNGLDDKSSRDIERAEEALRERYSLNGSLTEASGVSSLIAPDSGFAPWEEADFDNEVRRLRVQMDAALEEEQGRKNLVAGITFSLTTGLLIWSLRASSLLLAMMSMLPLWRGLDPLPILDEVNKKKKELEQQRKDREREDKSAKEVGYLFDHAQNNSRVDPKKPLQD